MADFKDKFSGKEYRVDQNISASLAAAGGTGNSLDGRRHEFLPEKEAIGLLPQRIKSGDQAKFFPGLQEGTSDAGILTGSIVRDTVRGIVYVPLKKSSFQNNIIGPNSFISTSFTTTASYLQVSAAFASQFSSVGDDVIIQYMVEENYTSSGAGGAGAVPAYTSSADLTTLDLLTSSFSGIDNGDGVELVLNLTGSSGGTHARLTSNLSRTIFHSIFTPTSSLVFRNSGSGAVHESESFATGPFHNQNATLSQNSFHLSFITGSGIFAAPAASGSGKNFGNITSGGLEGKGDIAFGRGEGININSSSTADGTYVKHVFKGGVFGDADSGSLYDFFNFVPGKNGIEVIIYPPTTVVASASFHFMSQSQVDSGDNTNADVTGSTNIKELFYVSSSTTPGFSGLLTSSLGPLRLGSILHADKDLKTPAEFGYYSISGSTNDSASLGVRTHTFNVATASIDNSGITQDSNTGMKNPRIVRTFAL